MSGDDWRTLQAFVQTFATPILAGIGWMLRIMMKKLDALNTHIVAQNGRITKIEQWLVDHQSEDTRQFGLLHTLVSSRHHRPPDSD